MLAAQTAPTNGNTNGQQSYSMNSVSASMPFIDMENEAAPSVNNFTPSYWSFGSV